MNKDIATNRQALRDYFVLERFEAGIELKGGEVKSVRAAMVSLKDSFARIENGQVFLYNMYIAPYEAASFTNVDPIRPRKLLFKKSEIIRLTQRTSERGFTLVPLRLYFSDRGFAKIEIALCKGKKIFDKRRAIKKREVDLEIRRAIRRR